MQEIHRLTMIHYDTRPTVIASAVHLESGDSFDWRPVAVLPSCYC